MEDDAQSSLAVLEDGVVARAHQPFATPQDGVAAIFSPGTFDVAGRGVAYGVFLALVVVAGVGEVVALLVPDDVGSLVHFCLNKLPGLRGGEALAERALYRRDVVGAELALPYGISVVEAYEEEPCRAVVVEEDMGVDALLVA